MNSFIYTMADSIRFWRLTLYILIKKGVIGLLRPNNLFKIIKIWYLNGSSLNLLCAFSAIRYPDNLAVADDEGELTFVQLSNNSENIACALYSEFHIGTGSNVAIMCRNHRDFILAALACSRLGANLLFINTDFPGSQIESLLAENKPDMFIYDEEFIPVIRSAGNNIPTVITHSSASSRGITLSVLADRESNLKLPRARQGKVIVLTSGTTGVAKGAERTPTLRAVISPFITLLTKLPINFGMSCLISIPLFHGFGLASMAVALALGAPVILQRRFDPAESMTLLNKYKAGVWVVVPVMLHRLLAILPQRSTLNDLQAIVSGGAPIRAELVQRTLNRLGPKLFNLYGTSEAGFASIATPDDLAKYPATIGRKGEGVELAILDRHNEKVAVEKVGRICIGGKMVFSQYINAENNKKIKNNFIDTGDLGYLNSEGYLFLCGRQDNMIVSGGENVFPDEVENLLAQHPDVEDVAVIPIDDEEFGQRLHAFIVIKPTVKLTDADFKAWLQPKLARYKMPAAINLVDDLPRNMLGKTNQRLLH